MEDIHSENYSEILYWTWTFIGTYLDLDIYWYILGLGYLYWKTFIGPSDRYIFIIYRTLEDHRLDRLVYLELHLDFLLDTYLLISK